MDNSNPKTDVDDLVSLGVIELLLNPEFAGDWLRSFAEEVGLELTFEQETYLNDTVARTLDQLAMPFVESLPEPHRKVYGDLLKRRDQAIHPLNEQQIELP